ncbi:MAG: AAA family ATPase [Cyanobacteria bacterium P01_F01_bin.150]
MEIKLKFHENFQSFASIKNTFEIHDLKAFSVLSGVNGIGKSQFLKAISGGYIDVEIDGKMLTPDTEIEFFNHENFKLENEQKLPYDFLEKKTITLINLFFGQAPLSQFKQLCPSINEYFNEDNNLLAFTKLLDFHDQNKHFNDLDLNIDNKNSQVQQQLNQLRQAARQSNWAANTREQLNKLLQRPEFCRYFEPNTDLGRITPDVFYQAIDKHQNDEILKAGFGEVFKKANDGRIRYIINTPDKSMSVKDLEAEYQQNTRPFPWIFINELFEDFRKGSFDFKYRFVPPTEQSHEALKPRLINDKTGEEIDFSMLSSGEKVLLTLCLFLYQSEQGRLPRLLLLDEIDATLHPSMCKSMVDSLQSRIVSKGTAIVFSTHTPFTIREFLEDPEKGAFIMKKDNNGEHFIENSKLPGQKLFDRSPTYGEIMWKAFDMPTIEFHIDLYNALHSKYREELNKNSLIIKDFDQDFFVQKCSFAQEFPWKSHPNRVSFHTYLRNKIHHPKENGGLPDDEALAQSIKDMISLL